MQFGKQAPLAASKKRAKARRKAAQRRKTKQKAKVEQLQEPQQDATQSEPSAPFQKGDVVMAWMDTMYYPAQVIAVSGSQAEGITFEVTFLGWEPEKRVTVPAEWTMPVPDEYASTIDLSSYLGGTDNEFGRASCRDRLGLKLWLYEPPTKECKKWGPVRTIQKGGVVVGGEGKVG